jgi:hypothetical protein
MRAETGGTSVIAALEPDNAADGKRDQQPNDDFDVVVTHGPVFLHYAREKIAMALNRSP